MPELAEVEFYRRRWDEAGRGRRVRAVEASGLAPTFRGVTAAGLRSALAGRTLRRSAAAGKQMGFQFGRGVWLGIHLGMTGELRSEPADYRMQRHDHLVLRMADCALVFTDFRRFGRIDLYRGPGTAGWWSRIAPPVLSADFTADAVAEFLRRRRRAPLKAVLLRQERFPGVGNWMADEILWRAGIHPARAAGSLKPEEIRILWRRCREVARQALRVIAGQGGKLPETLNAHIPDSWLFPHRWQPGGRCPRTGAALRRATIGGRTTCWSPARQRR
jgi:formamidopyrimidine-DNA glycosylase